MYIDENMEYYFRHSFDRKGIYETSSGYKFLVLYSFCGNNIVVYLKDKDPNNLTMPINIYGKRYWPNIEEIICRSDEYLRRSCPDILGFVSDIDYKYIITVIKNLLIGNDDTDHEKFDVADNVFKRDTIFTSGAGSRALYMKYDNLREFLEDYMDNPVQFEWFLKACGYEDKIEDSKEVIEEDGEDIESEEENIKPDIEEIDSTQSQYEDEVEGVHISNESKEEDSDEREIPDPVFLEDGFGVLKPGLYDLLANNVPGNSTIEPPPRRPGKRTKIRRGYTEEEVLRIAYMSIGMIASIYKVSRSIACLMQKNALYYLGIIKPTISKHKELAKYFTMEMEDDDYKNLSEFTGLKVNEVKSRHKNWLINRIETEPDESRKQWRVPVKMDLKELAKIVLADRAEMAVKYNCRLYVWNEICQKIILEQLSYNPFIVLGFSADEAFNEVYLIDRLRDGFMSDINKYTIKERCDKEIVSKVYQVLDIYQRTFDEHANILNKITPIPEDIPDGYDSIFMLLIRHRFEDKNIVTDAINANDFELTKEQIASSYLYRYGHQGMKDIQKGIKEKIKKMEMES